ncbi:ABC transporter substrate-binding protein [Paenibacillus alkalitolerans]|uniref:ABC transporter substrate-binding protein n=1 Tax=Paenibacillus alkalitolerans TaxID=2799335 RepID=UPI0018F5EF2E|nr:extracellular solute-binding protein [Paenibacillus alkalitolerans]
MKIKSLLSALLVLSLAFVVAACSGSGAKPSSNTGETPNASAAENASNEKITLKLWYWNGAISDSTIEVAKAKFTNIDLQAEKLPSGDEYLTKLKTTIAGGGAGPDIVAMDSWVPSMLPYKEKFVNLYDVGARDVQSKYLEWKWEMAATPEDDYLIGMPIDVAPVVLFYRSDLFEQSGVPSTPEELKNQVKTWDDYFKLQKTVMDATGSKISSIADIFSNTIGQNSKWFFDESGNYIGDQAHVKQAWDEAVKAYQMGLTFPYSQGSEMNAALNNGQISSYIGASWSAGDLMGAAPDTKGNWRIAYPPGGVGNQGGSFFGALKSTKHPKEAFEVIQFLVSPENLITAYKEFGNYPSTPELYGKPEMENKNEFFGGQDLSVVFGEAAKDVKIAHTDPRDNIVSDALIAEIILVDTQKKDPEQAWKDAQEKIKQQLNR